MIPSFRAVPAPHHTSSTRSSGWLARSLVIAFLISAPHSGCNRDKEATPNTPAATGMPVVSPPADKSATQKKPTQDPRAKPRPPEPPLLTNGSYTGAVASGSPGTVTFTLSEGRVTEASANLKGISFSLSGLVSGHKISLGGKEGDDFLRFMGKGTETQITGTWMGNFSGERAQGSWSARR